MLNDNALNAKQTPLIAMRCGDCHSQLARPAAVGSLPYCPTRIHERFGRPVAADYSPITLSTASAACALLDAVC